MRTAKAKPLGYTLDRLSTFRIGARDAFEVRDKSTRGETHTVEMTPSGEILAVESRAGPRSARPIVGRGGRPSTTSTAPGAMVIGTG